MTTFLDDQGSSGDQEVCPAEPALRVMRGRWKLVIVRELSGGVRRFSALQRSLNG